MVPDQIITVRQKGTSRQRKQVVLPAAVDSDEEKDDKVLEEAEKYRNQPTGGASGESDIKG